MNLFDASAFMTATGALRAIDVWLVGKPEMRSRSYAELVQHNSADGLLARFDEFQKACSTLGANISKDFLADAVDSFKAGDKNLGQLVDEARLASRVLRKEIKSARCFVIDPAKIEYFDAPWDKFDTRVVQVYPETLSEIDEAGKCFALGRNAACLFHLMRVIEVPLKGLGRRLVPGAHNPNWEQILKKIDAELAADHGKRTIQGNLTFYAELAAHMRAIKLAWRNRVMHVDLTASEEMARAIFEATVGFMNHVAGHFSQSETETSNSSPWIAEQPAMEMPQGSQAGRSQVIQQADKNTMPMPPDEPALD